MISHTKINLIKPQPNLHVSIPMSRAIKQSGLIQPIIINKKYEVHPADIERAEEFRRQVLALKANGAKTIISVFWEDLDIEERKEIGGWR